MPWLPEGVFTSIQWVSVAELILKISPVHDGTDATTATESNLVVPAALSGKRILIQRSTIPLSRRDGSAALPVPPTSVFSSLSLASSLGGYRSGRSRPVVMAEPVAMEDAVAGAVRLVEHWRGLAGSGPTATLERLRQHVAPWPVLQCMLPSVPRELMTALQTTDRDWPRRRTRAAEEVLATLLGWDQRRVHRRRKDFDNFERVDLRLASCEDCGKDIFRRRSEPDAPLVCSLCREGRQWERF